MSANATGPDAGPESEGFQQGWNAAMQQVCTILTKGRELGVLSMAAAMVDVGLDPEAAIQVMTKASPVPPESLEAGDVPH